MAPPQWATWYACGFAPTLHVRIILKWFVTKKGVIMWTCDIKNFTIPQTAGSFLTG